MKSEEAGVYSKEHHPVPFWDSENTAVVWSLAALVAIVSIVFPVLLYRWSYVMLEAVTTRPGGP